MGAAARVCREDMEIDRAWIERLSDKLKGGIEARMEHVTLNGDAERRYPGNLNFSFAYVEGRNMSGLIEHIFSVTILSNYSH